MSGPTEPYPPQQPQYPPPGYYPPPAVPPVPAPPGTDAATTVVGKAAIGTVTVLLVLFGVFCVLPALVCGVLALLGQLSSSP